MSSEGPQAAFVNPGGHLHETLTVYKVKLGKLTLLKIFWCVCVYCLALVFGPGFSGNNASLS